MGAGRVLLGDKGGKGSLGAGGCFVLGRKGSLRVGRAL